MSHRKIKKRKCMLEEIIKSLYDWNPWIEGKFPQELSGFPRNYHLETYLQNT